MDELIKRYIRAPESRLLENIREIHCRQYLKVIKQFPASYIPHQDLPDFSDEVLVWFERDRTIFYGRTAFELIAERDFSAYFFLYTSGDSATRKVLVEIGKLLSSDFAKSRNQYKHIMHVLKDHFKLIKRSGAYVFWGLQDWDERYHLKTARLETPQLRQIAALISPHQTRAEQIEAIFQLTDHPLLGSQIVTIIALTEKPPTFVQLLHPDPQSEDESEYFHNIESPDPLQLSELKSLAQNLLPTIDTIDRFILRERYALRASAEKTTPFASIALKLKEKGIVLTGEALRVREKQLIVRLFKQLTAYSHDERLFFLHYLLELLQ